MSTSDPPSAPIAVKVVLVASALFAIICMLAVGHRNSSGLLIALFAVWVLAPFAALWLLVKSCGGWARGKRLLLQGLSLAVCVVSAGVYGGVALGVSKSKPAFWFLVVPSVSLGLIALTYLVVLRNRSDRGSQAQG